MNRSTPGLPVHHQLPESTQTHVHCVSDVIQPSHPLSSPSPPAFNLSQNQSSPMSLLFASSTWFYESKSWDGAWHAYLFSSVQSLSHVRLFATPWTAAHQAFLSITNSWSSPKPMSIKSVMPSSHLILCHPLLLLPSIFPSIRVFSNESALLIRWPKCWSFSFSISPSNE